jgi:hypothetical protein
MTLPDAMLAANYNYKARELCFCNSEETQKISKSLKGFPVAG